MDSLLAPSESQKPFLTSCQRIFDWAEERGRAHTYNKDERISTQPGLIYIVQKGIVRLGGTPQISINSQRPSWRIHKIPEEVFVGFVGTGQPFEIVTQCPFTFQAYGHGKRTTVVWMYDNDLDKCPYFQREVYNAFRHQYQHQQRWISILGQRKTIARLLGLVTLLVNEQGQPVTSEEDPDLTCGYRLPFTLTHAQIASAIGSTRVTVTRLMTKLRQRGVLIAQQDNSICLAISYCERSLVNTQSCSQSPSGR